MIEVRAVEMPKQVVPFVRTWWRIYRDDPHWVPPLIFERKRFFDPRHNPYFETADVAYFQAFSESGEAVGTIAATVDRTYQKHEAGVGFFGFFEFVDDRAVSAALFEAASDWLRSRGMTRAIGPFSLNTNHEFGLLVDGFDTDPVVLNPHNSAYFESHYEALGMKKAMDWYAYWFERADVNERMARLARRVEQRHPELRMRPIGGKDFWQDVEKLHAIYDDAWEANWGHVEVTPAEFEYLAKGFRQLIQPGLCWAVDIGDETVAMSVSLPDFNQVAKKMNGRLFPTGWWHFLSGRRHVHTLRIFMLGVKKEYQHLPLGALLYVKTWEEGLANGFDAGEASLILEDNHKMRSPLEKMGARIYKTYRTYEIAL